MHSLRIIVCVVGRMLLRVIGPFSCYKTVLLLSNLPRSDLGLSLKTFFTLCLGLGLCSTVGATSTETLLAHFTFRQSDFGLRKSEKIFWKGEWAREKRDDSHGDLRLCFQH